MNKYLILNFKDAKLFRKDRVSENKKCKDISFTPYNSTFKKRNNIEPFIEPITVHQISNMLHVLFNERPVPSNRKVFYKRNETYFNIAQKSYLKINTPTFYNKSLNKNVYQGEFIQTKKAVWDSVVQKPPYNWELVKQYFWRYSEFEEFINYANDFFGYNVLSKPYYYMRNLAKNKTLNELEDFFKKIKSIGKYGGLCDNLNPKNKDNNFFVKQNVSARTTVNGVDKYASLRGQIIVPVSDEMINILDTHSKGFATLLDGGFVWIDSIKNGATVSIDEFTKVSDISDERMKF